MGGMPAGQLKTVKQMFEGTLRCFDSKEVC